MQSENKMGTMPVSRLLVGMSIPLMASLLIQSLYNIVDGVFVARLSEDALTATSLAYPLQVVMITVSIGTAIGVNAELSRLVGEKNYDKASSTAVTGLILGVVSSLVFVLIGAFGAFAIASAMTEDAEIADLCGQYLHICLMFGTGIFLEATFQRFVQATGKTMYSMIAMVVGAGTNIILDPILIFGYFCFPAMGVRGAAVATVIGQWLAGLTGFLLNTFLNPEVKLKFKHYRLSIKQVGRIYKVGLPTMVTNGLPAIMVAVMNAILLRYSSTAVAFFGVYYKLQNFLLMPINGLGQACLPIISFNLGTRNRERIKQVFKYSLPAAIIISLIATVVFEAIPGGLLKIFSAGDEMLAMGVPALRIISVTFVLASVTIVLGYSISGLGNGVVMMIGTLIRQLVLLIPVALILSKLFGLSGIWYAFWPAEAVAVIFMMIASKRIQKRALVGL
ncbi:MAG: MATE family efflux transporter [Clostridiales bacterium]|nr:MATE family efflux transporter [Clostridiales bacterium]